jgi:putative phosphoribosyl transferase
VSLARWDEIPFPDRHNAGCVLAALLGRYANRKDVVVLGLSRGGVPVGAEVARALRAPLDVMVVRKLGVPGQRELAMGAIAGGVRVLNEDVVTGLGIADEVIKAVEEKERQELERREQMYRGGRPARELSGCTVILVDDGLATGSTMRAAICAVRQQRPGRIVVAVPAAAPSTCEEIGQEVDECVCAITPQQFYAVGAWYGDFAPVPDEEVSALLQSAARDISEEATGDKAR